MKMASPSFNSEKMADPNPPTRPLTQASSNETLQPEPVSEMSRATKTESNHKEAHQGNSEVIRDIIIGFSDGLTVPFALTAGLSSYHPSAYISKHN